MEKVILKGRKEIFKALGIGDKIFLHWVRAGLPVSREGNSFWGEKNALIEWAAEHIGKRHNLEYLDSEDAQ